MGGWCWRKVVPLLVAAGHDVHAPTLTGLGERAHLVSRGTDLSVHARDVAAVLEYADLHDTVLVGHSSGGGVISMVANLRPERVAHLVYLDAFVPTNGRRCSSWPPRRRGPRSSRPRPSTVPDG